MNSVALLVITYFIVAVIVVAVVLSMIHKKKVKHSKKMIEELDLKKNLIASTPVLSELAKVEEIARTEKMEERFNEYKVRFEEIKEIKVKKLNDMITELDFSMLTKNKDYVKNLASTEMEIYKVKNLADHLLNEIRDIASCEEKYRKIVTDLKAKYRKIEKSFFDNEKDYDTIAKTVTLQLENIEKRFQDFDEIMEASEYSEAVQLVRAIETMIKQIEVVTNEIPDILLLTKELIPKKMKEIKDSYDDLKSKNYPLKYINLEHNIEETDKKISDIMDRVKVLNMDDCLFELKTIFEYYDSLFKDFEIEKSAKKTYDEDKETFEKKLNKTNKMVYDIEKQAKDIKSMYHLTENDLESLKEINKELLQINVDYKDIITFAKNGEMSFTKLNQKIGVLSNNLKHLEEHLEYSLKNLGSMKDDEERAKEQLNEIENILRECKAKVRSYKIPIISDNYFVELAEANEAIKEIIKELEKKPIMIKVLNTRVDTARDLVLKLYNTTNEMIKYACLSEKAITYANKYRTRSIDVDRILTKGEMMFYKGNYEKSFITICEILEKIKPGIEKKFLDEYQS